MRSFYKIKKFFNLKKTVYLVNSFTVLIQFITASLCSIIYPRELGLAAIFISIFGIFYQAAQFEGSYLYLSGKLSYSELLNKSFTTSSILFIFQILISLYFLLSRNFVSLSFFNQFSILCLGYWIVDLTTGKNRILDTKNSELKYQQDIILNLSIYAIIPNLISIFILSYFPFFKFIWLIFSFVLFLKCFLMIFNIYLLAIKNNSSNKILFEFPELRYILAPTIKRAESSSFLIIIGLLLGPTFFGLLQPLIKVAKSSNILTPIIMKLNFLEIDRKIKKKWLFPLLSFNYLLTLISAIFLYPFFPDSLKVDVSILLAVLIFLNFASTNNKTFLWTLNYKVGKSNLIFKRRTLLLLSKIIIFLVFYITNNFINVNYSLIVASLVIFEIIWILFSNNYITNKQIANNV